mmetsp:Transcript_5711/g.6593  ORF Transcript_5711/g.6593 Transcript_5711/m.6593 type:complete len:396 (+) Transcript_5711:100-1287(+)
MENESLIVTAESGDLERLEALVQGNPDLDLDVQVSKGLSLLDVAIENDQWQYAQFILELGASSSTKHLERSLEESQWDFSRVLLQQGYRTSLEVVAKILKKNRLFAEEIIQLRGFRYEAGGLRLLVESGCSWSTLKKWIRCSRDNFNVDDLLLCAGSNKHEVANRIIRLRRLETICEDDLELCLNQGWAYLAGNIYESRLISKKDVKLSRFLLAGHWMFAKYMIKKGWKVALTDVLLVDKIDAPEDVLKLLDTKRCLIDFSSLSGNDIYILIKYGMWRVLETLVKGLKSNERLDDPVYIDISFGHLQLLADNRQWHLTEQLLGTKEFVLVPSMDNLELFLPKDAFEIQVIFGFTDSPKKAICIKEIALCECDDPVDSVEDEQIWSIANMLEGEQI